MKVIDDIFNYLRDLAVELEFEALGDGEYYMTEEGKEEGEEIVRKGNEATQHAEACKTLINKMLAGATNPDHLHYAKALTEHKVTLLATAIEHLMKYDALIEDLRNIIEELKEEERG